MYKIKQKNIEKRIGYTFSDPQLLETALTHSSFANEHKNQNVECNERLEFLGDSVLSLLVSEHLYKRLKKLPEGELTKIRAAVVCEHSLYKCALSVSLGDALRLGRGEENTNGRLRPSILADAFEALIAAVYIDGGFKAVINTILPLLLPSIDEARNGRINRDYKTILQEIVQKNKEEILEYVLVAERGPDHKKSFIVDVFLNNNPIGRGEGKSKKEAEQLAAKKALMLMGEV